jgi:hypothetical protein
MQYARFLIEGLGMDSVLLEGIPGKTRPALSNLNYNPFTILREQQDERRRTENFNREVSRLYYKMVR